MDIRLATKDDIGDLVEFNLAMALETEGKQLDTDVLRRGVEAVFDDDKKGFYVVVESEEGVAAGLMVTYEWSDWRNGWFWWIQSVFVRPQFRGRGLYGEMYAFVNTLANEAGNVCGFRLYVEQKNQRAQRVYEKLGMEKTYYLMFEEEMKNRDSD